MVSFRLAKVGLACYANLMWFFKALYLVFLIDLGIIVILYFLTEKVPPVKLYLVNTERAPASTSEISNRRAWMEDEKDRRSTASYLDDAIRRDQS